MIGKVSRKLKKLFGVFSTECLTIKYYSPKDRLIIRCPKTFDDRAVKSLVLFMDAYEKAKPEIQKSFEISLYCGDFPPTPTIKFLRKRGMWAYSKSEDQSDIILFPDFSFVNWRQTGMSDYEECTEEILKCSEHEAEYNTLFWIGNTNTHFTRQVLCDMSSKDPRIEAYGMEWNTSNGPSKYVSLKDHTKYKYLIDIQGCGWSARTKILFFSGRCLFLVDRKWKEYWYDSIKPFVHYIPVKEDLSDLTEKLDWAEAHPDEVKNIAANAKAFAKDNLTRASAIEYLRKKIIEYANDKHN